MRRLIYDAMLASHSTSVESFVEYIIVVVTSDIDMLSLIRKPVYIEEAYREREREARERERMML